MARALEFYTAGLGLEAARVTDEWAELRTTSRDKASNNSSTAPMSVCLQVVTSEAQVTTGYSPLLQFQLENMDDCIAKCVQLLGGHLDGPIQHPAHGKAAALRSPDGHMIGVYEPAI